MTCFNRRTASLCFLAIVVISPSHATAGKTTKPGPTQLPDAPPPAPAPPPSNQSPPPTQPPPPAAPPPVKGWPHAILTANTTDCAREPGANEVLIYPHPNFTGSCASLKPGFYPFAANLLIGDDKMSSIKVGSAVRARVFEHPVYGGNWNAYPAGTRSGGLGGYNDTISSMRVELASRSQTCDDVKGGEIALYRNPNLLGDCVVLPGDISYPNAESMGIADDSISSILNNSARKLQTFWHPNFDRTSLWVDPYSRVNSMHTDTWFTTGINDNISSIQMQ